MELSDIRTQILDLVQDDSFNDEDSLNEVINRVRWRFCTELNFPALKVVGAVTAAASAQTASLVSLTSGFSGRLARVYTSRGKARIFATVEEMYDWYIARGETVSMDTEGQIEAVAQEGNVVFLYKVPEAETVLTCIAYSDPSTLSDDSDECELIPPAYQYEAYVHGSCYYIYDKIEDGVEDPKTNTLIHYARSFDTSNRESAMNKIREYLGKQRVHRLTGAWDV